MASPLMQTCGSCDDGRAQPERLEEFRLLLGKDYQLANLEAGGEERRIRDLVRQALHDEAQPPRLPTRDEAEQVAALIHFLWRQYIANVDQHLFA